jgi:hypothetical protein
MITVPLHGNGTIVIEKVDRGVVEFRLSGNPLVGSISGEEKLMQEAKASPVTKLRLSDGSLVTITIAEGGSGGTRWSKFKARADPRFEFPAPIPNWQ